MNQSERRIYLIKYLLSEHEQYRDIVIPRSEEDRKRLLRSLFNVRPPAEADAEFIRVQDEYLKEAAREKGVTRLSDIPPVADGIYLWQGDITALECGAIVNAANSGMTGCYHPLHNCIDNAIHTYAGVQLRKCCADIINEQGHEEPAGTAKITPAYNLPCKYVIHTVGPMVQGILTRRDEELLSSCYRSCLSLADENGVKSTALCCISTGAFGFPQKKAAQIAVDTVKEYRKGKDSTEVIFNVFKDSDYEIYKELLG